MAKQNAALDAIEAAGVDSFLTQLRDDLVSRTYRHCGPG
jgi:hypothetical protein